VRERALKNLAERDISALVVIGGNGSQAGAYCLSQAGFPVVGIASTIDNDIYGSEITLGVDTALNIALTPLVDAATRKKELDLSLFELAGVLAA
jgi:6-phosphofructokinase 1